MSPVPALAASGLAVELGGRTALADVSFEVPAGSTVAMLGPNGAGKTTLFRAAIGLVRPEAGTIEPASRRIAFVPQRLDIEPSFPVTVADVARMGRFADLGWWRRFGERDRELVAAGLEKLGISALAERRFGTLSGGERQRALLAQAHAQDAELLLLDEPFSGLDAPTRHAVREVMAGWSSDGRTVIVATHDLESAVRDYDLVLCLNRRVVAFGPPAVCTEEVLAETFAGHVVRIGQMLIDTAHHHHDAS